MADLPPEVLMRIASYVVDPCQEFVLLRGKVRLIHIRCKNEDDDEEFEKWDQLLRQYHVVVRNSFHLRLRCAREEQLFTVLQHLPNLRSLDLSWDDRTTMLHIYIVLQQVPHLTTLTINNSRIDDNDARNIANGLQHVPHLRTLNLAMNEISPCGASRIAHYGLKHVPHLTTLDLSSNKINNWEYTDHFNLRHIVPNLTTLNLRGNRIDGRGAEHLFFGLRYAGCCDNLTTLDISSNQINDKGALWISYCLRRIPNLTTLDISSNRINDQGARWISNGLRHVHNLTTLDLASNGISDVGARRISDNLQHVPHLRTLNLRQNQISDVGEGFISNASPRGMQRSNDGGHCWTSEGAESAVGEEEGGSNQ